MGSVVAARRLWRAGSIDVTHRLGCPTARSSWTMDRTRTPALAGGFLTAEPPGKSPHNALTEHQLRVLHEVFLMSLQP